MAVSEKDFLKARRDRALGSILGYAENMVWDKLSPEERAAFRKVVLEALNNYHDSVLDLVKSDNSSRNDEVVQLLERIASQTRQGFTYVTNQNRTLASQ